MAENEKEQLKKFIHQLPNAVNGDGKAFVAQLKKALSYLSEHAGGSGGGEDSGEGEDAINQVTALRLMEVHTVDSSGFPKNNIEVTFENSNIENYAFAQIWVKDDTENTYQQHGNTNGIRYLFENALVGRTYTVKVVVQLKDGRTSNFDNAPTASILIQGSVLIPDAPTQFFLTWDEDGALWQWQYEENEYIDFFELRLDANAGVYNDKLLDRTRLPYSRANPNVRSGTAYLFIRNVFGDYSTPATHIFNKPVGVKPNKPVLQSTLDGVVITMSPLPTGYQGYVLEIDGEEFKTINRQFVYYKFSGTVKARYCYYDEIGRGEWSEEVAVEIERLIDTNDIAPEAIVADLIASNAITSGKIVANAITADKIEAGSITNEKITDESVSSVKIEDGAITATKIVDGAVGSTKIEGGAITTEHIQAGSIIGEHISAGAISADKLYAGDIDMTGELALVGGAVRLNEEGLTCLMADGASTVFDALGITYFNKNGSPYSQIRQSCMGYADNGQTVTFQNEWDSVPTVICIPTTIQIADKAHKDSDILLKCKAVNVTKSGFDVQCYTCLPSGSSETIGLDVPFVFTTDTEFAVNNEIIDTPSEITITFDTEGYSGRDGSIGKYRAWYTFDVYNDGVLIGTGAGAAAPTNPGSGWDGGRYLTTKANVNINASVERIGVLTVKVWVFCYYFRPSGEPTYNYTPSFDPAHLTVQSITYTPKDDIVISTGTALFVAMSDANTGYSVSDAGVTPFALRRQYRLGV